MGTAELLKDRDNWLRATWFNRPAVEVAPDLIGCIFARRFSDNQVLRGLIVETEAYEPGDPACHGYRKKTPRNGAMFGPPGIAYVYLIYGIYHCLNLVTQAEDVPSAVLIRALELSTCPPEVELTQKQPLHRVAAGPGKLCRALAIDRTLDYELLTPKHGFWVEGRSPDFEQRLKMGKITLTQTTRIGLTQGTASLWRWYLTESKAVSRR